MIWNQVPFLRILSPFILGIWLSQILPGHTAAAFWFTAAACLAFALSSALKVFQLSFRYQWVYGVLLNVFVCGFGYALTSSHSSLTDNAHFSKYILEGQQGVFVEVLKPVAIKEKSVHVHVEVRQVYNGADWSKTLGRAIIYLEKDTSSRKLEVGDQCIAIVNLEEIQKPRNPGAFDYAKYLSRSDIFYSAYASAKAWKLVAQPKEFNLLRSLNSLKVSLQQSMVDRGVTEEAHAVISALTLGDKNELSPELKTAYSKAGVLHILAVSGLHVGIIYLVLSYLFFFLKNFKNGALLKAVCIILLLWGYAMLTGMSPSVARASTMFSFVIVGSSLKRYTNIYNTLCVSAFFLLLIQPLSLYNVGFLLSYTAVFGIVLIYPIAYGFVKPNNWLSKKIWALVSVSLAAQIATFPLSLYYFHQFPNYFLLANLIVVPLAIGIMYMSLICFVLLPMPLLADPLAKVLNYVVEGLNLFVRWIETLPFSVADGIDISKIEVLLIYMSIGFCIAFITSLRKLYLYLGLFALLSLALYQVAEQRVIKDQHQLVVYNISNHSCFDVINSTTSLLTLDSSLVSDQRTLGFATENHWRQIGIEVHKQVTIEGMEGRQNAGIISVIRGHRVLYPIGEVEFTAGAKVNVDILILSKRCRSSIEQLAERFDIGLIILDSSISGYRLAALVEGCVQTSIPYHNVAEDGAFVREF